MAASGSIPVAQSATLQLIAQSATLNAMLKRKRKPRPSDAAIKELFEQDLKAREIAERLDTTLPIIRNRLHLMGLKRYRIGAELARLVRDLVAYQKAHPSSSFAATARHFHIQPAQAGRILTANGCQTPFPPRTKKPPQIGMHTGISAEQIVQAFREDEKQHDGVGSARRVAKNLGISGTFVAQVLSTHGCRAKRKPRPYDLQKAGARYNSGESLRQIAKDNHIGEHRLRREMVGAGFTIRPPWAGMHAKLRKGRELLKALESGRKSPRKRKPEERIRIGEAVERARPIAAKARAAKASLLHALRESYTRYARFKDAMSDLGFSDVQIERTFDDRASDEVPLARHFVADAQKMDFDTVRQHHRRYLADQSPNSAA